MKPNYDFKTSHSFVETFSLKPYREGLLSGLKFAVKDIIDIKDHVTACGNPSWRDGHEMALVHAPCVEQLLTAGAECVGKTLTDEMAFSLGGENFFFGTPINPKAPDRVPGGSSSGSASAVACDLVDFALGTDTGGSVRVPAHNCGIYGLRPSHGIVSVSGVLPFAPTFDTVGILSKSAETLRLAGSVLLGLPIAKNPEIHTLYLLKEAWEMADGEIQNALKPILPQIKNTLSCSWKEISLQDFTQSATDLNEWRKIYCTIQWAEIWNNLGPWIQSTQPELGPRTKINFELARGVRREEIGAAISKRERLFQDLRNLLSEGCLIAIPTAPALAPLKGSLGMDRSHDPYYARALSLTSLAGIGRLPQIHLPLAEVKGVPTGVSLLAGPGKDNLLLAAAESIKGTLNTRP